MSEKSYSIKTDCNQWILVEAYTQEGGKNDGQLIESNIGYYSTLEGLARSVHNKLLLCHGLDKLEEAFAKADALVESAVAVFNAPTKKALEAVRLAKEGAAEQEKKASIKKK